MSVALAVTTLGLAVLTASQIPASISETSLHDRFIQDDKERVASTGSPVNLTVTNVTYKTIDITWEPPNDNVTNILDYKVLYKKASIISDFANLYERLVNSNITVCTIKGLSPGTKYEIVVAAIYNASEPALSLPVTQQTLGYGLDNACDCNHAGINVSLPFDQFCDPYTGECRCVNKFTKGARCDHCVSGYYWHSLLGCKACFCPRDGFHSEGSCHSNDGGVIVCDCLNDFVGVHCDMCKNTAYKDRRGWCRPCECSGNADPDADRQCNNKGKCIACVYNTTGSQCQRCQDGYVGDARHHNCTLAEDLAKPKASTNFRQIRVIIGATTMIVVVATIIATIVMVRRCRQRHKPIQLWTVALHDNREEVDFAANGEECRADHHLLKDSTTVYTDLKSNPTQGSVSA